MKSPSKALIFVAGLFWLGACTTPGEPTAMPEQLPVVPPEPVVEEPVNPETETEAAAPEMRVLGTRDLLGMAPAEVQTLLGPVSLKRWEGEIQVMQFSNDHCVIDIYFYETAPGEAFEATYLNARNNSGEEISKDICLASLLPGGVWAGEAVKPSPAGQQPGSRP